MIHAALQDLRFAARGLFKRPRFTLVAALSLAVMNVVDTILFGSARDPLTFLVVPLALTVVALAASLVPALRASRVDPLSALGHQ